jgi:hypothetical protein
MSWVTLLTCFACRAVYIYTIPVLTAASMIGDGHCKVEQQLQVELSSTTIAIMTAGCSPQLPHANHGAVLAIQYFEST